MLNYNYIRSIGWYFLSISSCAFCDVLSKLLSDSFSELQIISMRYFFGILVLLPVLFVKNNIYAKNCLCYIRTKNVVYIEILKAVLFVIASFLWIKGISISSITCATIFAFTIPLFTTLFAFIFLKEKIKLIRVITISIVFTLLIIVWFSSDVFDIGVTYFMVSIIFFSLIDILNKKVLSNGDNRSFSILFCSSCSAIAFSLPISLCINFKLPDIQALGLFFILGLCGSLVLFCFLKAIEKIDITAVLPYRYFEIVISATMDYFIFGNIIDKKVLLYGFCILPPLVIMNLFESKSFS